MFPLSQNDRGVAVLMMMTSVALLAFLLSDFTFETKVNKLKIYNSQDKFQARLNAEAGLNFAMSKLRIYQEARNLIESNENIKSFVKPSQIESVLLEPFVYPIPNFPDMGAIQRSALQEFRENTLFQGQVNVTIKPVSGFLNPNNMRIAPPDPTASKDNSSDQQNQGRFDRNDDEEEKSPELYMEETLTETLRLLMEDKRETDTDFDIKYGNLEARMLIKELKYYISDKDLFDDAERGEFESRYLSENVRPKYAPLTSLDELHLLLGWPDEIVELIRDKLTVHEVAVIAVNELTEDQLKILFPFITDFQIEEFFRYRNGDQELGEEPQEFKTAAEFKQLMVNRLGVLDSQSFDERMKEFEKAGLKIGVAGKLYKVTSRGVKGRAEYNLVAYVDMPLKPQPEKPKTQNPPGPDDNRNREDNNSDRGNEVTGQDDPEDDKNEEEDKTEYMVPRILEIQVE